MTAEKLIDAVGEVRGDYIRDAELPKPRKKHTARYICAAACLCIVAAGAYAVPHIMERGSSESLYAAPSAPAAEHQGAVLSDETEYSVQIENIPGSSAAILPYNGVQTSAPEPSTLPMIESYGNAVYTDIAVGNGCCQLSDPLSDAISEYGNEARYRVVVDLFRDGKQVASSGDNAKAEMERLADDGYTVAYETVSCEEGEEKNYFPLHADADQLTDFSASDDYGYCIRLYGEALLCNESEAEEYNGSAEVFNGSAN